MEFNDRHHEVQRNAHEGRHDEVIRQAVEQQGRPIPHRQPLDERIREFPDGPGQAKPGIRHSPGVHKLSGCEGPAGTGPPLDERAKGRVGEVREMQEQPFKDADLQHQQQDVAQGIVQADATTGELGTELRIKRNYGKDHEQWNGQLPQGAGSRLDGVDERRRDVIEYLGIHCLG